MLLEVDAQLMSMEMGFLCFSSALKSLFRSLWRGGAERKNQMGFILFHTSVSPTSQY